MDEPPRWSNLATLVPLTIVCAATLVSAALRLSCCSLTIRIQTNRSLQVWSQGILATGHLDTNWALYDVGMHRHPQYNFSSYLLILSGIGWFYSKLAGVMPDLTAACRQHDCRRAAHSMRLSTRSVACGESRRSCRRSTHRRLAAVISGQFVCASRDVVYVRISCRTDPRHSPLAQTRTQFVSSVLVGGMVACKISAIVLAPPTLLIVALQSSFHVRLLLVSLAGSFFGFVVGSSLCHRAEP